MSLFTENNPFDTEVNPYLLANKVDNQSSVISNIMGGAVASAVDIGASLFNSLPGVDEVATEEILGRIGGDALRVYQENPDTIRTISLIGGAIIPGGAAIKGLNAFRNGSKAVNWFTTAGKKSDIAKATQMLIDGKKGTSEYKNLIWGMRGKTVGNALVDTAIAEGAILATMNAHPYMEDYFEDPVKNFGVSMMFGGGLGVAGGLIGDAFQLNRALGAAESTAQKTIIDMIVPVSPAMPEATAIRSIDMSIQNIDNIMKQRSELGKNAANDLVYQFADKTRKELELEQLKIFDTILSPEIRALDVDKKQPILDWLKNNDGSYGVTSIKFAKAPEEVLKRYKADTLTKKEAVLKVKNAAGEDEAVTAYYFPEIGKYGTKKDLEHHAGASILRLTPEQLVKRYPDKLSYVPNSDYGFEALGKAAPQVEADFAGWTIKFGQMGDEALEEYLKRATLSAQDVPQIQALAQRISKSDKLRNTAKIKIADRLEVDAAALDGMEITRTAGGTPVRYKEQIEKLLNNKTVDNLYDIRNSGSPGAANLLKKWIAGDTYSLHEGAVAYFARGYAKASMSRGDAARVEARNIARTNFQAIYEHPRSVKLREDLRQLADKDGKIYLYRGVNTSRVVGQSPLESMAVTISKTSQFAKGAQGRTMLYKVDVEDVVAAVHDIGPSGDNVEVIVRTTAREAEAVISSNGQIQFRQDLAKSLAAKNKYFEARLGDLNDYLKEEKYKLMNSLLKRGYPVDSIAKRLNMPPTAVEQFMASDLSFDSFEALTDIVAFKSADDAIAALSEANRPLELRGNLRKADYTAKHANLNAAALTNIDTLYKGSVLMNSSSEAVRRLGQELLVDQKASLDLVRHQLHFITQSLAGNRFFTSADQFARKMGDIGPIFSYIGKQLEKIANDELTKVVKPITDAMTSVSTNQVALTEFSTAVNLNASLRGWRLYKDGQFWQKVERLNEEGKKIQVLEPVKFRNAEYKIVSPEVDTLLKEIQSSSKRLYDLSNARNKILGSADLSNIGFWMPSWNPVGKFIAYVHNKADDTTQVLYGKTPQELADVVAAYGPRLAENPNLMIVTKDNQEWWSKLNGRLDPVYMQRADIGELKTGSGTSAIPRITTEVLAEVANGYEHHINAQVRNLADLTLSDITDTLKQLSAFNKRTTEAQPLNFLQKAVFRPKDPAMSVRNLLLGNPSLGEYDSWVSVNRTFENSIGVVSNALGNIWEQVTKPVIKNPFRKQIDAEAASKIDFEKFNEEMQKAGAVNPFATYDEFLAANRMTNPDVSRRVVTASNALAATMALRFAELAHPIINLVSMPILMSLANTRYMPEKFMGIAKGTSNVPLTQIVFEGARAMNSPRFKALSQRWEELGYYKPLVSEASAVLAASKQFEKGAVAAVERALESKVVEVMSKPADFSEAFSRKYMMHAGAVLAKRLYPELNDNGVTIFARDFMDKALGNYSASQRPALFQGTLGVAMGLFQTYMLTLAQNVYKNIETKDWATLAKAAMAQSTIFGTSSLPGFDPVSKAIADNFSDDNYDLTTGTFRALGDPVANWTLYGVPSNLTGAGFYTRGDIDPRFPNILDSVTNLVGMNFAMQAGTAAKQFAKAVQQDNEDVGQALLQALSLQSMSRPLARGAELLSGASITQQGNTVQTADEVRTFQGIVARVLGTRPMEEAKLREAMHLERFYNTLDRDRRDNAMNKLRTSIRNGTLTEDKIAEVAEEYMRFGGSPRGWQSAFNNALARTNAPGEETFIDKIDPDSPFLHMISNLD